jgi:hypothetical protein
MKFLCVPCESAMKLQTVSPPERGSLSVVYSCPECGYEMAMLTNPFETQLVQSLGVRIGPQRDAEPSSLPAAWRRTARRAHRRRGRWSAGFGAGDPHSSGRWRKPGSKFRQGRHDEITVAVLDGAKSRFRM